MKKRFILLVLAGLALACQSQAASRWSLKYTNGHHHVTAIITTGDFDPNLGGYPFPVGTSWIPPSRGGGYPIISITGERDGVPIAGMQHAYPLNPAFYAPYNSVTNPWGGVPRYVVADYCNWEQPVGSTTATQFAMFDNVVVINAGETGFDLFGLSFNAGGLEYNVFSDGVSIWELDAKNLVATGGAGELVTHFEIRQLPKGRDDDDCGHKK
jgi:hypothetical protein